MTDWPHTLALLLTTRDPQTARTFVQDRIEHLPREVCSDIVLLVSEIVTNAVLHGDRPAHLAVTVDDRVRIEVHDGGPPFNPQVQLVPGPDRASGRGMRIIDTLASAWGVLPSADGRSKAVWFEM